MELMIFKDECYAKQAECQHRKECAQHVTAGDYRTEGGPTPSVVFHAPDSMACSRRLRNDGHTGFVSIESGFLYTRNRDFELEPLPPDSVAVTRTAVDGLPEAELITEPVDQLRQVREIVQEWADKQGHERCWWFPELFRRLADVLAIEPRVEPGLPLLRDEFEQGCRRYQDEQYGPSPK